MKKVLALMLALLMLSSLAACGGKDAEDSAPPDETVIDHAAEDAEEGSEEGSEETPEGGEEEDGDAEDAAVTTPELDIYSLQSARVFPEGPAFISFRDDGGGTYCSGIINDTGKLQYYISGGTMSESQNKNGYMYAQQDQTFYMITPKGETVSYELNDDIRVVLYGDGFVVTEEHKAGFEAVEYVYHVYNSAGKELTTYSTGDRRADDYRYIGEGTFYFRSRETKNDAVNSYGYSSQVVDLYFGKSNTWHKNVVLAYDGYAINTLSYKDGILMIRGANQNGSNNTHPGEFTYADDQGAVKTLTVPADYGTQPRYVSHDGGVMLFIDTYTKQAYTYDMKANSWASYQGKYTEQKNLDYYPALGDGYVALPLRGADNNIYTTLLDKSMKDVLDSPVAGTPYAIQDGVLYTYKSSTVYCYDLKGTQLGEFESMGTDRIWLDAGILVSNQNEFLKPDGTTAFEKVSYSGAKQIILAK